MPDLPINDVLVICLGAIAGANARYFLSRFAAKLLGPVFPYGTLIINVVGSLIVGFFLIWTSQRVLVDPRWRLLVVVGFCGSAKMSGRTKTSKIRRKKIQRKMTRRKMTWGKTMTIKTMTIPNQQPAKKASTFKP